MKKREWLEMNESVRSCAHVIVSSNIMGREIPEQFFAEMHRQFSAAEIAAIEEYVWRQGYFAPDVP